MDDPLLVDRPDLSGVGDLPAHTRIGSWLEQLIVSHTLAPGDKLPSEVEISNALGVSRMTLRQALASIEAKGLIDRRRGRFGGNFVAAPRFEFDHASLPGFTEQMRRIHVEAGAEVSACRYRSPHFRGAPAPRARARRSGPRDSACPIGQRRADRSRRGVSAGGDLSWLACGEPDRLVVHGDALLKSAPVLSRRGRSRRRAPRPNKPDCSVSTRAARCC